jgi:DNA-binding HxlR family transcriptional regulator
MSLRGTVFNFLPRKGAIDLICELGSGGARFTHLDDSLDISHPTISKRLQEAEKRSLIEADPIRLDHGRTHRYILTPKGAYLWWQLYQHGTVEAYYTYKKYQENYFEHQRNSFDKFRDQLGELDQIEPTQKHKDDLEELDEYEKTSHELV